jgi:hypothetical protein
MDILALARMRGLILAATVLSLTLATGAAHADVEDLLGLYAGGSVGQSRVQAADPLDTPYDFSEHHTAFKVIAGIRPISFLGAEIEYLDLGHPSSTFGPFDASVKGEAAYGMLFLPMGVPFLDLFGEAGGARLETQLNGPGYACSPLGPCPPQSYFHYSHSDTNVAAGAGVQYRLGPLAVRGEYEHFSTAAGNPTLLSLGLSWTFF